MSLIERNWRDTMVDADTGKVYVWAQEAQVELHETNRAAWDRVAEAEQQLRGAVAALVEIALQDDAYGEDTAAGETAREALGKLGVDPATHGGQ